MFFSNINAFFRERKLLPLLSGDLKPSTYTFHKTIKSVNQGCINTASMFGLCFGSFISSCFTRSLHSGVTFFQIDYSKLASCSLNILRISSKVTLACFRKGWSPEMSP